MSNKNIKKKAGVVVYHVFAAIYMLLQIAAFLFLWKEGHISSLKIIAASVIYLIFSRLCMDGIKSPVLSVQLHFWFMIVKIILSVLIFDGAKYVTLSVVFISAINIIAWLINKAIIKVFGLDPYNPSRT